ncbi:hypothetical protein ADH66_15385 [Acutalibacter muris]|uniref:Uncharacterized protein n=1 Tax=Acutalibacter muris TaxID=1796620 RepID=A0ABN5A4Y1_9FIRM|nr:hypothetical protein ADH66_15385 [Acutalibacter muris]
MHMRVVRFIVESREPLQVSHRDAQVFRKRLGLGTEHIPPAGTIVKAEPLCIFTSERNNYRPHVAAVFVELLRHLCEIHLYTVIREQPMRTEPFGARAGSDIIRIGFSVQRSSGVVLDGTGDKFRGGFYRLLLLVVLVLEHISSVRKIAENFIDQLLLIPTDRGEPFGVINFLHTITGSDILCVPSTPLPSARLQELKLRN